MGAHVCAHVYLITPFCARLLLGVLRALSFEPFARLSLPSLEIELWSPRVVDFYRHTCVSAHMPLIPPSLWPSTAIIRSFQVNNNLWHFLDYGMFKSCVVVLFVPSYSTSLIWLHIQLIALATEETTVTQRVSHRPIKYQSRSWSLRGTKVNGSYHGDNPLLRPTGI